MADKKISQLNTKSPPVNADSLPILDSVASATKRITFTVLKSFLKTYFDTLYGENISGEALGGSGKNRTLAQTPLSGTLKIYDGSARLYLTTDYTIVVKAVTFIQTPDDPRADYKY